MLLYCIVRLGLCKRITLGLNLELVFLQDGVELGIYIKDAMEAAGKGFADLSPEQIAAALREYEIARSHRVAHIISKSGFIGNIFLFIGLLVGVIWPLSCLSIRIAVLEALLGLKQAPFGT